VAVSLAGAGTVRVRFLASGMNQLTRTRQSPVGRDIQRRAIRVTRRMRENVSGDGLGPRVRSGNLRGAISFLRFGVDGRGIVADIGPQPGRMIRRGWNYSLLLETGWEHAGAGRFVGPFPWLVRSLEAARD